MTNNFKALVHQYVKQVWNKGDLAAFDSLTMPAYKYYLGGLPERDRVGMHQFIKMIHEAFPDWQVQIVDIIAEENKIAILWHGHVTHKGVFQGIPPTGKQITVSGINIYHIFDGKIATEWEHTDTLGMLQQLGLLSHIVEPNKIDKESSI